MDFLKILRSIEDFLYEAMTWVIFYPRTLWQVIRRPLATMSYSDAEQAKPEEQQYRETLNPLLFLLLSLLIAHGVELAANDVLPRNLRGVAAVIFGSDLTLLISRAVVFSVFPLMFALAHIRLTGAALNRDTLRGPFLAQCFIGAVFAMAVSLGGSIGRTPGVETTVVGFATVAVAVAWFVTVQYLWLIQHLHVSPGRAVGEIAIGALRAIGLLLLAVIALVAVNGDLTDPDPAGPVTPPPTLRP